MTVGPKTNSEGRAPGQLHLPGSGSPGLLFRPRGSSPPRTPSTETFPGPEMPPTNTLNWLFVMLREFALILNADGAIQSCWTSNHDFFCRRADSFLLGRRLGDLIDPGFWGQLSKIFQRALETGQNQDIPYSIQVAGVPRCFLVRVAPLAEAAGGPPTLCLTARDCTERVRHLEQMKKTEVLLEHAEQIASLGSWEYDLPTKKLTLSPQLRLMYGLEPRASWGVQNYWERVHPEDRARARKITQRALAQCQPFEYTSRFLVSGLRVRTHFLRGLPLGVAGGKVLHVVGIVQDITGQAQSEEDLRRLSHQLLRARDEGHRRVARELHESAGQSLAALKMTLGRLRDSLPTEDPATGELLQSAAELADAAIREVRTVSYLMHPPLLDHAGLGPALRWYADGFSQRSGIAVVVEVADDFGRCSQETETTIFRIVQEALTNVHRHSGSHTATIRLFREERHIVTEVQDEGCGLQPSARGRTQNAPYGVGIAGMRERVKHLDGVFNVLSDSGHGTTVRAILPLSAPEAPASISRPDWSV